MDRSSFTRATVLACLVACPLPASAVILPPGFVVENAAPGVAFDTPVAMAFLPDGRFLVGEKQGRVWMVKDGVRLPAPVWSAQNEVLDNGDRGLIGIAADPRYFVNHSVYFLYTVDPDTNGVDTDDDAFGRLVRYRMSAADSNVVDPASRAVLFGRVWREGSPSGSWSHTVGGLQFGTDGTLLVTIGDGGQYTNPDAGGFDPGLFLPGRSDPAEDIGAFRSQYLGSLAAKMLRLDPATGHGLPSNPYWDGDATSVRSRVWAYGVRNPYRFAIRPGTGSTDPAAGDPGTPYVADVGWWRWEEVYPVVRGANYGWPCYDGVSLNTEYQLVTPAHSGCNTIGTPENPALPRPPMIHWSHDVAESDASNPPGLAGPCAMGAAFVTSTSYPVTYRNTFVFGDYLAGWMKLARTNAADELIEVLDFAEESDGPVDIASHPLTGDLFYVSIYTGEIRRIRYDTQGANRPPVASAGAVPSSGPAPLVVAFSSAGSHDPDGDPLAFAWAFGDGQTSTEANPTHTYASDGLYAATLTVRDGRGGEDTTPLTIWVSAQSRPFPTSAVLDSFQRADGALGGAWTGQTSGVTIDAGRLRPPAGAASIVWNGAVFGPDQEAFVTIDPLAAGAPEHDLMLKVQGTSWDAGHLEIRYDATISRVAVSTYTPGPGWNTVATYDVALAAGDRLGARAGADGAVEVYRNGVLVGIASVAGWPYAASGGRVGLTLVEAMGSRLDDFGGGDAAPIAGVVIDDATSLPLAGAKVAIQATAIAAPTALDGRFALHATGASLHVVASKQGYFNASVVTTPPAAGLQIRLKRIPQEDNASYRFMEPAFCNSCHTKQVAQWTDSPMAKSGRDTWVYDLYDGTGTPGGSGGFVYKRDSRFAATDSTSECASCHQPESWIKNPYRGLEPLASLSNEAKHGVSCEVCHKTANVDETKMSYPGMYPGVVTFLRPPTGSQLQFGVLGDTDYSMTSAMRPSHQPQLAAAACGACHQDKNDPDGDGNFEEENGVVSEGTYQEWKESAYADPASASHETCASCHMPASGDLYVCEYYGPQRDPEQVRTQRIEGTTPEFLENAVSMALDCALAGNAVDARVTITNDQTGHHVPSGTAIRNLVLLVEAWREEDGVALVSQGSQTIDALGGVGDPAQGYYAGLPGKLYARVLRDPAGATPAFYTEAVGVAWDHRLPALASDETRYRFLLPAQGGTVRVRARLLYRRAFRELLDQKGWTVDGHGNPLADLAAPHYGHLMEEAEWVAAVTAVGEGRGARGFDLRPAPNPFADELSIDFTASRAGRAIVTVVDVGGRHVATLFDAPVAAGTHTVLWKGRDGSGRRVPGGVYLCRVQIGGEVRMRRVVRLP